MVPDIVSHITWITALLLSRNREQYFSHSDVKSLHIGAPLNRHSAVSNSFSLNKKQISNYAANSFLVKVIATKMFKNNFPLCYGVRTFIMVFRHWDLASFVRIHYTSSYPVFPIYASLFSAHSRLQLKSSAPLTTVDKMFYSFIVSSHERYT
jgi:hypothetical protein